MPPILQTIDLTKAFDMVTAADALNVSVARGERLGIVGANGSGKTTFLNLITGYLKPDRGRIVFMGRDSTGLPPRLLTKRGIARSFALKPRLLLMDEPTSGVSIEDKFQVMDTLVRVLGPVKK